MSYYKKIEYIDCYEQGEKIANAGFVKLVRKPAGNLLLQIQVTNSPEKNAGLKNVSVTIGERSVSLGQIRIENWRGIFVVEDLAGELLEKGEETCLSVEECLSEILIKVDENRVMWCKLEKNGEKMQKDVRAAETIDSAGGKESAEGFMIRENVKNAEEFKTSEAVKDAGTDNTAEPQELPSDEEIQDRQENASEGSRRNAPSQRMAGSKWQQLEKVFPHIHPFEDDRVYLQMDLQDFVVLQKSYYRLVENSFLLHGYYNYEHLILTKEFRKGAEKYFVGVPGNYYEKEKQVAVLFGFESFEPREEPAMEGDFGYYMISVDI